MKNQSVNRFPQAANGCLARLFVVIALLAGYGECFASPAVDPAPPSHLNAGVDLVWVRQDPPVINVNNDPTEYVEPAGSRFAGSYWKYTITDTEIAWDARYVDHDYEWYKVKMKTVFDRPPIVLNPPLRYKVTATASHSGTSQEPSPGFQFWYNSPGGSFIEPNEVLPYYPFDPKFTGLSSKDWMINPPAALHEGATFKIYASWWNCYPCNVTWTYRAEPANAVPRLGVEVVQPIVIYQGQEKAPGDTFFPETCPAANSQMLGDCSPYKIWFKERAGPTISACQCSGKILTVVELLELSEEKYGALAYLLRCQNGAALRVWVEGSAMGAARLNQSNTNRLALALDQGAMHLKNMAGDLTTSIKTPLGTAVAAAQGGFLAAYNPVTSVATFRAYAAPLILQPNFGSDLILQPHHEVKLTSSGFGPITALPLLHLPLMIR